MDRIMKMKDSVLDPFCKNSSKTIYETSYETHKLLILKLKN